ncbi:hypothetical protein CRG98_032956 [Punica granatum]|uniref:Uncharacterized protein n=1 Tax=Punica granatum TaxID=22663 RepID=A0A2I0IRK3_PUNGR|nr:hypothetical protein CRG98_032956 [Punica granatum]
MAAHDEAQRLITQGRDSNNETIGFVAKIGTETGGNSNPNFGSNRAILSPAIVLYATSLGVTAIIGPPAINYMGIQALSRRIRGLQRAAHRGNLGREEEGARNRRLHSFRSSVGEASDNPNLEARIQSAHHK